MLTKQDDYSWDEASQDLKDAKAEAQQFAQDWGIPYYKLSAKTESNTLDDVFKNLACEIHWVKSSS